MTRGHPGANGFEKPSPEFFAGVLRRKMWRSTRPEPGASRALRGPRLESDTSAARGESPNCSLAWARAWASWWGTRPPRASNKDLGSRSLGSLAGWRNTPGARSMVSGSLSRFLSRPQRERISPAPPGSQNRAGGGAGCAPARVAAVAAVGELLLAGRRARITRAERARNLHLRGEHCLA